MALREDVTRAREQLDANLDDNWAEGAHALALFVCGPGDLFEVLRLPRPVDSRVTIADRPAIEPLALLRTDETHREREALDRVGASGVRGIVDVLPALYERRVATLLIEPGSSTAASSARAAAGRWPRSAGRARSTARRWSSTRT